MSEEKNELENLNEEAVEETTEIVEEAVEATEPVEPVVEEASEEAIEANEEAIDSDEEAEEAVEITDDAEDVIIEEAPKKSKLGLIVGIVIAVIVVAVVAALVFMFNKGLFNKYNRMGYIDISGKTIAEIADESGYELQDFLAEFNLPADMQGNTYENAAYYTIPVTKVAEMYGMDFATLKEMLALGDDITEETTWGIAQGEATLANWVGEENLDEFKELYGFGDEITAETKFKEVRNVIDQQARDERIAQEKALEESADATEAPIEEAPVEDDEASNEATEAPAENEAAAE